MTERFQLKGPVYVVTNIAFVNTGYTHRKGPLKMQKAPNKG